MANVGRPKGTPKTGGRKKGTLTPATATMRDDVLEALKQLGGVAYLVRVGLESPPCFMAYLGKFAPREVTADLKGGVSLTVITGVPDTEDE